MPYPGTWMLTPELGVTATGLELSLELVAQGARWQKRKQYDDGLVNQSSVGKKPHQLCVKPIGDIDGACDRKNAWDDTVRTFVPLILDISVVEWEHHKAESLKKLRNALDSEFKYVGGKLSRQGFWNAIKRFLKDERSRLKTKYLAEHTKCPLHVQPA